MAEYIERDAFKAEVRRLSTHYLNEWDTLGVLAAVDRIPAADVRPVVLCKDCKHSAIDLENMRYCKCVVYYNHVSDDWFCADGEKREES